MRPIRQCMVLGLSCSLLALTAAQASALPFAKIHDGGKTVLVQDQPKQDQSKSQTFTGTVVRNGEQFMLRDSTGSTFKLDDSERAQKYEGKAVRVTGTLDADAKLIHVEQIESASA